MLSDCLEDNDKRLEIHVNQDQLTVISIDPRRNRKRKMTEQSTITCSEHVYQSIISGTETYIVEDIGWLREFCSVSLRK